MATGFSFGAPAASAAPSTGFSFGAPAATAAAPSTGFSFGAPASSAAPASGLSFGASNSAPAVAPSSTGFSFGAAAAPAASTAFSLGQPPAAGTTGAAPGLSFGQPAAVSTGFGQPSAAVSLAPASSGLSFGASLPAAGAPATGLAFGAASTASGFSLGSTQPLTTSTSAGFALGGVPPTSTQTGFGFGAPAATTTASAFGFGAPATSSAPPPFGTPASGLGGLGGLATSTSAGGLGGLGGGLGGTVNPLAGGSTGTSAADPKSDIKTLKEAQIPAPLSQTVEEFKKYVKEERSVSSDITHISSKIHQKIRTDTDLLLTLVKTLSADLARCKSQMNRLKVDVAQDLIHVEIAQRTRDTPPALQYENTAPYEYFAQLVASFEAQMIYYKRQIEETEHYLQTMTTQGSLSIDDITKAIARMQDTFTNLAGRFQKIHEAVQKHKDLFVQAYRVKHGMAPEIFVRKARPVPAPVGSVQPATTLGPSPFSDHHDLIAMAKASLSARLPSSQQPPFPMGASSAAPPTFGLSNVGGFSSWSSPKPLSSAAAANTLNSLTSTPGLLGSTMSPFSNNQTSSLLQGGGKRGKF